MMQRVATAAVILAAAVSGTITVPSALHNGPTTCGMSCTASPQCALAPGLSATRSQSGGGEGCSRCDPVNNTCTQGLPCLSPCDSDLDCDQDGSCPFCYFGACVAPTCGKFCNHDKDCAGLQGCGRCKESSCAPTVPTPSPTPATPAPPPTPQPTFPPGSVAWGALYCYADQCGTWSVIADASSQTSANDLAFSICGDGEQCNLQTDFGGNTSEPCLGLAVTRGGGFGWAKRSDAGTAATQAMVECHESNTHCYLVYHGCALLPPPGSRFGAVACANSWGGCTTNWAWESNTNSSGYANQTAAAYAAVELCEQPGYSCNLRSVYYNCFALATNSKGAETVTTGDTLSGVKADALKICNELDRHCTVVASDCIYPYA